MSIGGEASGSPVRASLRERLGRIAPPILVVLALIVAWEAYARVSGISPLILPAPSRILSALIDFRDQAVSNTIPTLTETLVGTLRAFAETAHLSEFFVAVVIVAIVGNATEHGSAVLLARRGRTKLAVEIPLASSAQIAGLLIPLVALLSWFFDEPLALSFRPVELAAMGIAAVLPAVVLRTGRTTGFGGAILLVAYTALVAVFYLAGDR